MLLVFYMYVPRVVYYAHLTCCLKDSSGTRTKTWWSLTVGTPTPPSALGATPASPQRPSTSARWAARSHTDNVVMNEFRWLPVTPPLKQHLTPQRVHQQARIGRAMRRYCNWYWRAGADDYSLSSNQRYSLSSNWWYSLSSDNQISLVARWLFCTRHCSKRVVSSGRQGRLKTQFITYRVT